MTINCGLFSNNKTDPNKLLPMRYKWARQHYKTGISNNWVPEEIPMQDDIELWNSDRLSDDERRLILWNLGFFSTAESLTGNNLVLAMYRHITDPAVRQAMIRQTYEEALHSDTFVYCCDSLGLNPDEIYSMYETIPSIKEKDDFVVNLTQSVFNSNFIIHDVASVKMLMRDLVGFYVIMEGIYFYAGFAMMLAMRRMNRMRGVGEQFHFIMRDESMHLALGMDIINTIRNEVPECWDKDMQDEIVHLVQQAVALEGAYAYDACPNGLLGINAESFDIYVKHMADRRLERLDLPQLYKVDNPFPWISAETDINKRKNFFETRVTEYDTGGLDWD